MCVCVFSNIVCLVCVHMCVYIYIYIYIYICDVYVLRVCCVCLCIVSIIGMKSVESVNQPVGFKELPQL